MTVGRQLDRLGKVHQQLAVEVNYLAQQIEGFLAAAASGTGDGGFPAVPVHDAQLRSSLKRGKTSITQCLREGQDAIRALRDATAAGTPAQPHTTSIVSTAQQHKRHVHFKGDTAAISSSDLTVVRRHVEPARMALHDATPQLHCSSARPLAPAADYTKGSVPGLPTDSMREATPLPAQQQHRAYAPSAASCPTSTPGAAGRGAPCGSSAHAGAHGSGGDRSAAAAADDDWARRALLRVRRMLRRRAKDAAAAGAAAACAAARRDLALVDAEIERLNGRRAAAGAAAAGAPAAPPAPAASLHREHITGCAAADAAGDEAHTEAGAAEAPLGRPGSGGAAAATLRESHVKSSPLARRLCFKCSSSGGKSSRPGARQESQTAATATAAGAVAPASPLRNRDDMLRAVTAACDGAIDSAEALLSRLDTGVVLLTGAAAAPAAAAAADAGAAKAASAFAATAVAVNGTDVGAVEVIGHSGTGCGDGSSGSDEASTLQQSAAPALPSATAAALAAGGARVTAGGARTNSTFVQRSPALKPSARADLAGTSCCDDDSTPICVEPTAADDNSPAAGASTAVAAPSVADVVADDGSPITAVAAADAGKEQAAAAAARRAPCRTFGALLHKITGGTGSGGGGGTTPTPAAVPAGVLLHTSIPITARLASRSAATTAASTLRRALLPHAAEPECFGDWSEIAAVMSGKEVGEPRFTPRAGPPEGGARNLGALFDASAEPQQQQQQQQTGGAEGAAAGLNDGALLPASPLRAAAVGAAIAMQVPLIKAAEVMTVAAGEAAAAAAPVVAPRESQTLGVAVTPAAVGEAAAVEALSIPAQPVAICGTHSPASGERGDPGDGRFDDCGGSAHAGSARSSSGSPRSSAASPLKLEAACAPMGQPLTPPVRAAPRGARMAETPASPHAASSPAVITPAAARRGGGWRARMPLCDSAEGGSSHSSSAGCASSSSSSSSDGFICPATPHSPPPPPPSATVMSSWRRPDDTGLRRRSALGDITNQVTPTRRTPPQKAAAAAPSPQCQSLADAWEDGDATAGGGGSAAARSPLHARAATVACAGAGGGASCAAGVAAALGREFASEFGSFGRGVDEEYDQLSSPAGAAAVAAGTQLPRHSGGIGGHAAAGHISSGGGGSGLATMLSTEFALDAYGSCGNGGSGASSPLRLSCSPGDGCRGVAWMNAGCPGFIAVEINRPNESGGGGGGATGGASVGGERGGRGLSPGGRQRHKAAWH
ncbi:hypothetical protein JKP88DRAFT_294013 [Tribonema minus]|uniref:Uncharacterized protein n=1 Tax=Tribonema minus TaxID=303371 RepID=A0A835ZP31_9STRA|nr:hypothetical protein JKP88DRAFT_294013 [Tribonema minus]